MAADVRRKERRTSRRPYTVCWEEFGVTRSTRAEGLDVSTLGVGIRCCVELRAGTNIYIESQDGSRNIYGVVRHCTPRNESYIVGVEFNEETKEPSEVPTEDTLDYYELLQISPNAEISTVERIYRFLAARYHPDNPQTGDAEQFISLTHAYDVLSNPDRRAEYDANIRSRTPQQNTIFQSIDFMDGVEGEVNRRVAVLALLYNQCRTTPDNPRVSLADLEARMGFPREYLDFTTWYLRSKKYITREDNSDFALTALGVDYVEANYTKSPVLIQLLNAGKPSKRDAQRTPRPLNELFVLGAGKGVHSTLEGVDGNLDE
jgi:curved DNA-binding protein